MVPLWVPLPRALLRDELPVVYIASASRSRGPSWNPPRTSTNHASMFGLYFLPVTAPLGAKEAGANAFLLPNWYMTVGSRENGPIRSRPPRPAAQRSALIPPPEAPPGIWNAVHEPRPPMP